MVMCKGCKQDLPENAFAKDKYRSTGRRYKCRACSSAEFARWKQTEGYTTRLEKERSNRAQLKRLDPKRRWAHMALHAAKARAKAKGLAFELSKSWLLEQLPDTCPLLGTSLNYANTMPAADSPAIDRVNSAGGYTPDNCWVISMKANRIKSDATLAEIEAVAHALRTHLDKRGANAVQATNTILHAA